MHIGKSYGLKEFLVWTRRRIYPLAALAFAVTALYRLGGWCWIALPWQVVALLGTAASFIVGFKNTQTYGRTLEAQQLWSSITAASRYWGLASRDFPTEAGATRALVDRHLAWLTAVRYQLRAPRVWEDASARPNLEYRRRTFAVPEHTVPLASALARCLPPADAAALALRADLPAHLMAEQSRAVRGLFERQAIAIPQYSDMQKTLKELIDLHARVERIKNCPYPRQYAIVNALFIRLFAVLLPFGMVREFAALHAPGMPDGRMAWLTIPFAVLVGWMYLALDQVGQSSENPFEGSANDVPITQISYGIEHELRVLLGETDAQAASCRSGDIVL